MTLVACSDGPRADGPSAETAPDDPPPRLAFDAARAFRDLRDLVAIGPRPAGSPAAEQTRALIRERLRQAGWRVRDQSFEARPPFGDPVSMVNLIGVRQGQRRERLLVGTHYDTKLLPGTHFVGANDGASGAAVLLELARQLAGRPLPFTVWLVFFDGEEAFGPAIRGGDGLYGSRALAEQMLTEGSLAETLALIVVDMLGDRDLNLTPDLYSSRLLRRFLLEEARASGLEHAVDLASARSIVDDHVPFLERGLERVLLLIDFQFGARRTPGPLWHTAGDGLGAVSEASLNTAGTLAVRVFERIEQHLLAREQQDPS